MAGSLHRSAFNGGRPDGATTCSMLGIWFRCILAGRASGLQRMSEAG